MLIELLMLFIKHEATKTAISAFLAEKNISTFTAKSRIIANMATLVKNRPEQSLPDDLIKIANATFIDYRYLEKEVESLNFKKRRMTKRLYRQRELDRKK